MLVEQGVAPAAWDSQSPPRDASGHRPSHYEGCLQWLERVRMNGGETCRDNVRVIPSGPDPEVRFRGEKSPQWSAGRRACRVTRHAAPPQVPELLKRLAGAPLPHVGEGRKRTADPKARLRAWAALWPTKKWGR